MGSVYMTPLPEGFALETAAIPPPPEGFVLAPPAVPTKTFTEKLGETWPVRLAKGVYEGAVSGLTLPGDVMAGRAKLPSSGAVPGSVPFGDPESVGLRVADLAGFGTPVNPAIRAGDRGIAGVARALEESRRVPTTIELKAAADDAYAAARGTGVEIETDAVKNVARAMQSRLEEEGIFESDAPRTFANLARLQEVPVAGPGERAYTRVEQLESARKAFGHAAESVDKTERKAASESIQGLDDFLSKIGEEDVLAGDAASASKFFENARGNYAAAMRSENVTGAAERADLNAAVANSGQNIDNATRQRMRDILVRPKETRGYSKEELEQLERVARGTVPTNIARNTGNMLGGGGGIGAFLTAALGGAAIGFPGIALPAAGYGAKKVANALTNRQVGILDDLIRQRSPLYAETPPTMTVISPEKRAAVMRALLLARDQQ